jgi:hypothetical protein
MKNVDIRESLAVLALLAAILANRLTATALAAPAPATILRARRRDTCSVVAARVELDFSVGAS